MYHILVSVVCVLSILAIKIVTAAPTATPIVPATVFSMLSVETGRFVMFSDDGQISANGDFRKLSISFIIYDGPVYFFIIIINAYQSNLFIIVPSPYYNTVTPESTLSMHYRAESQLRIQFVHKLHYLIFENGEIQAGEPVNGNDLLEVVTIRGGQVALRVVHSEVGSGSGSGETEETPSDCYIGFSDVNSKPKCYKSSDFAATRFIVIEH